VHPQPKFLNAGDMALVVELGDAIRPDINQRVHDLRRAIEKRAVAGVVDLVPTYRSLLVYYDPLRTTDAALRQEIAALEAGLAGVSLSPARIVEIPTTYGGEFGPDLGFVSEHTGLPADEVIRIHSGTDYLVYMMGFTAGFPYLGGMSSRIATPRLKTPRTRIPAGSVGIAQEQTGIYPTDSPGGWQIIGRSPVRIFDAERDPPVVIEAGDYIRFVPVGMDTYREVERQVLAGTYVLRTQSRQD
jgi:KipI family sensor histidine kinase inhibitor